MHRVTMNDHIQRIVQIFLRDTLTHDADQILSTGRTLGQVREALSQIDLTTCSQAEFEAVGIGRAGGWTMLSCDECQREVLSLIRFDSNTDYDPEYEVCLECLQTAIVILTTP